MAADPVTMQADPETLQAESETETLQADPENCRWARDHSDVVWCNTAEGLRQAVQDGNLAVEVGACADVASVLDAVAEAADELEYMSFAGCGLDADGLSRLGEIFAETGIMGIGVSNNPGVESQPWVEFWARLPVTVHKWDFGDNGLSDDTLPRLAAVLQNANEVTELFLDGNELTQVGPLLPVIKESACLTELDLGDNSIGDDEVLRLAEVLPVTSLTTLVLGRNPISDVGAVPLVQALAETRISCLHLDTTRVGDATLDALTQSLLSTRLEELHIDETQVRDAAILRCIEVLPRSSVKLFDCGGNSLREDTIQAIEAALPSDMVVE